MANQYRKQGNHLYKLNAAGDAYVHCAILPLNIKSLAAAIRWYEQLEDEQRYGQWCEQ